MTDQKWSGKKVLIVDDSPEIRAKLRDFFSDNGFTVSGEAENGIEALSAMEGLLPDLVSLDLIMPEMDGMECYQFIRRKFPSVQCMFVSILSSDSRVYEAYQENIEQFRFVPKPINASKLIFALENIYDCYQAGEEMEQVEPVESAAEMPDPEELTPADG